MDSLGGIAQVDDKKNIRKTPAASTMIRYAPRQVILQPGETQAVRLMVRKPTDLQDGEYRSHMLFQRLQAVKGIETKATETSPGISMSLLIGTSIPIFIREGDSEIELEFDKLALNETDGTYFLNMQVKRKGLYSSRAIIKIFEEGSDVPVMMSIKAMYTDNDVYIYKLPVQNSNSIVEGKKYTIEIEYDLRNGKKKTIKRDITA